MRTTSKFAAIFGVLLFILGCGIEDILLVVAAALLTGFGTQGVLEFEPKRKAANKK